MYITNIVVVYKYDYKNVGRGFGPCLTSTFRALKPLQTRESPLEDGHLSPCRLGYEVHWGVTWGISPRCQRVLDAAGFEPLTSIFVVVFIYDNTSPFD